MPKYIPERKTKKQLVEFARRHKLKRYSRLNKPELIILIKNYFISKRKKIGQIKKIPIDKNIYLIPKNDSYYKIYFREKQIGHFSLWDKCTLHDFRLDEKYRRKGIGTKVYLFFEKNILNECKKLKGLATLEGKPFWESLGFKALPSGLKTSFPMEKKIIGQSELVFYHGTIKFWLSDILKEGLKETEGEFGHDAIYLTKTPEEAIVWSRLQRESSIFIKNQINERREDLSLKEFLKQNPQYIDWDKPIILEIRLPKSHTKYVKPDYLIYEGDYRWNDKNIKNLMYNPPSRRVSPKRIKIYKK